MNRNGKVRGETIVDALWRNVDDRAERPAMRRRVNSGWETLTWADYGTFVAELAAGLVEHGIAAGDQVAILSNNRVEWHVADLAIMSIGATTVPIYQTSAAEQVAYVLGHGDVRFCFVEDRSQLAKVLEIRDSVPKLDHVAVLEGGARAADPFVTSFEAVRALGRTRLAREPDLVRDTAARVGPDSLATLVYTSGTTGPPKGAMITHANIMWTLRRATDPFPIGEGERLLSFLPLSHIAERMMSDFFPIASGSETWFARSLATVAEDLPACRPTVSSPCRACGRSSRRRCSRSWPTGRRRRAPSSRDTSRSGSASWPPNTTRGSHPCWRTRRTAPWITSSGRRSATSWVWTRRRS